MDSDGVNQRLIHSLVHLCGVNRMEISDHLDRPTATDRLHHDPNLELGSMGAELALWREVIRKDYSR